MKDRIRLLLSKFPESRYNRGLFFWHYLEEYHGASVFVLKKQFLDFWKDEASIERTLRDILKEPEYKPEPKADIKRYEKSNDYKVKYQPKDQKEREQYNKIFNL